jgi:hypothetical protein
MEQLLQTGAGQSLTGPFRSTSNYRMCVGSGARLVAENEFGVCIYVLQRFNHKETPKSTPIEPYSPTII